MQPVKVLIDKYQEKSYELGHGNVNYATMIENIDDNIGRLVKGLQDAGKFNNTFLIFTSDNGGLFKVSKQHPLRAGKGSYSEGGIRVPFFFVWPEHIKENQKSEEPISNLDLFPTLLDIAQIEKPKGKNLDGNTLIPILTQKHITLDRPLFWHFPIYLEAITHENENRDSKFRTQPGSVIRKDNWKLHHYFEDNGLELYNLKNDIGEQNDLIEKEPEKARELLNRWREETNAPILNEQNPGYKINLN